MRPGGILLIGIAAVAWLLAPPSTTGNAVSFNCSKASHPSEFLICGDPVLSDLDDQLAASFSEARRRSSNPAQLAAEEREWLARRDSCRTVACVAREYRSRLAEVSDAPSGVVSGIEVPLLPSGGTWTVPVSINDRITLDFTIDSGAADVSIPADVVMTLVRTGSLTDDDFLGKRTYTMADGTTVPSTIFRIRSLKVGNKVLENVTGSITSVNGQLLLGQSFLARFRSWSINNQRGVLILE
jgi:uncharacterized protein